MPDAFSSLVASHKYKRKNHHACDIIITLHLHPLDDVSSCSNMKNQFFLHLDIGYTNAYNNLHAAHIAIRSTNALK